MLPSSFPHFHPQRCYKKGALKEKTVSFSYQVDYRFIDSVSMLNTVKQTAFFIPHFQRT